MSERDNILGRIREALRSQAPRPGALHGPHPRSATEPPGPGTRQWLPRVGSAHEEQLAQFRQAAADLKTEFLLANSANEMRQILIELRNREGWKRAACHSGPLTDAICPVLDIPLLRTDRPYDVRELESCDVGVSECDALVAQTGSVLVTGRSAGGRALSVLPPHHVVLARSQQLLPDLTAAFALVKEKYAANYPSFISLITGPSRTGDIERILVQGAHGPKKLTLLCLSSTEHGTFSRNDRSAEK